MLHARDRLEPAGDVHGRAFALHTRGTNHDLHVGVPPRQYLDHVADRRALERGDDADLSRQRGQRALARGIEEAFVLQPLLHLLKSQLKRANALGFQVLADELIVALGLVDGNLSAGDDFLSVSGLELEIAQGRPEHEPAQLRRLVLQREVEKIGRAHV